MGADIREMRLIEEKPEKLFSGGLILKLGTYCISPEGIFYGIHIPTDSRKTAEIIMKKILDDREVVERLKEEIRLSTMPMDSHEDNQIQRAWLKKLESILGDNK